MDQASNGCWMAPLKADVSTPLWFVSSLFYFVLFPIFNPGKNWVNAYEACGIAMDVFHKLALSAHCGPFEPIPERICSILNCLIGATEKRKRSAFVSMQLAMARMVCLAREIKARKMFAEPMNMRNCLNCTHGF